MATPVRLGDFELAEEIGRGGFGIVYRARQASLDRPVAVKVLFRHLIHTDEQVSRFEREARAAARLDHSSLVSVFAWGQSGEDFFIAQRLIGNGRTLADVLTELRAAGEVPKGHFRRVAEWMEAVARGLQHAHERGIVHRDVKPSNVLLDEQDTPCLGDFGLAKVEDGLELSRTGDFAGSPFYMSPEQADSRRGRIDPRTDVYSLGVTLYEMLALRAPFQGTSSHEILRRILVDEPERPTRIESRVPADLETICLKAMEKSPALRYQSAGDMAADLHAFLLGEPIAAVPVGTVRRLARAARRHRAPVALVALVVLVIVGAIWGEGLLRASRQDADRSGFQAAVQQQRAEELSQINTEGASRVQAAVERRDEPSSVAALVRSQQEMVQLVDENYRWIANQVASLGDGEELRRVATGFAARGLIGGMQGLQEVVATRNEAGERDRVLEEVGRRMKALEERLPDRSVAVSADGSANGRESSAADDTLATAATESEPVGPLAGVGVPPSAPSMSFVARTLLPSVVAGEDGLYVSVAGLLLRVKPGTDPAKAAVLPGLEPLPKLQTQPAGAPGDALAPAPVPAVKDSVGPPGPAHATPDPTAARPARFATWLARVTGRNP